CDKFMINQIGSNIFINPQNKSYADFSVIPLEDNDFNSSLSVVKYNFIESNLSIRKANNFDLNSNIGVFDKHDLTSFMDVVVSGSSHIKSSIFVNPKNKAFGNFEVMQPIILTMEEVSIADSFVRNKIPRLN